MLDRSASSLIGAELLLVGLFGDVETGDCSVSCGGPAVAACPGELDRIPMSSTTLSASYPTAIMQ